MLGIIKEGLSQFSPKLSKRWLIQQLKRKNSLLLLFWHLKTFDRLSSRLPSMSGLQGPEEAGVDMILAWGENLEHTKFILAAVRKGAPNTLIGSGLPHPAYASEENCLTLAGEIRLAGTDIVYCSGLVPDKFAAMARQHVPCCGHVGYLPCNNTWLGGPRAVGKSHEEAKRVYNEVMEVSERSERALDRQWRAMPLSWTVPEQSLCAKRCAWPNPPPCSNLDV